MNGNFIKCGFIGWTAELCFSSLISLTADHDKRLIGRTSLFMFPIYGMAAFLKPINKLVCKKNILVRGGIYTSLIFLTEYCTGWILQKFKRCPWDYSKARYNINGLIRLDYAPLWFLMGLIFESVTCPKIKKKHTG